MNGTSVVGYIALLMICGSILGGEDRVNLWGMRADAMSASSFAHTYARDPVTVAVVNRGPEGSKYIRLFIDGIPYEGTIYANSTDMMSKQK